MSDRFDTPLEKRSFWRRSQKKSDRFGEFSERFATFMGTPRFILWMTVVVVVWIAINVIGIWGFKFDPYPFILLNLMFSTQASYAAPIILLAQNRQDRRDRVVNEQDRQRAEQNLADTEFLIREIATLRLAVNEVVTRDYLRSELRDILTAIDETRQERLDEREQLIANLKEELEQLRQERSEHSNPLEKHEYTG